MCAYVITYVHTYVRLYVHMYVRNYVCIRVHAHNIYLKWLHLCMSDSWRSIHSLGHKLGHLVHQHTLVR